MSKLTRPILLYGTAETCPDIRYLTGFQAVDPVLVVEYRGQASLVVSAMERGRARREARGALVYSPDELPGLRGKHDAPGAAGWVLRLLKGPRRGGVVVPGDFPVSIARALERAGVRVRIADRPVCSQRQVKTPREIRQMRTVQKASVEAMRVAVALIGGAEIDADGRLVRHGKPLTAEMVRTEIEKTLVERGCIGQATIVACGKQAADPHERGRGVLRAHEPIVIDIFPRHAVHGYWGDITRTVVKGRPSGRLMKMYEAVKSAQQAALGKVRAGVSARTVHAAAVREFDRRCFKTERVRGRPVGFIHGTGHGVGLQIHEAPGITSSGKRLRAGNVITIEPGLYYPSVGGIRIEDTVVVTRDGCRRLASCRGRFVV